MEQLNEVEFRRGFIRWGALSGLFSRKDCHVCQEVHPLLEGLAEEYADQDFGFYNVDVDEQRDLFQKMALKGSLRCCFSRTENRLPGLQAVRMRTSTLKRSTRSSVDPAVSFCDMRW